MAQSGRNRSYGGGWCSSRLLVRHRNTSHPHPASPKPAAKGSQGYKLATSGDRRDIKIANTKSGVTIVLEAFSMMIYLPPWYPVITPRNARRTAGTVLWPALSLGSGLLWRITALLYS